MTYKKKLIEVALPLATINAEAAREKSIRHGHPSTLHLWWARRPLAAARAVLWASLVDDPSAHPERFPTEEDQQRERERLFDVLRRLVPWEASNNERVLEEARVEILKSCDGDLPKVLDPFGGGGAIPLESLRLGLPTSTGDLNPVAVMIQRAMLEIPARFVGQAPVHSDAIASQVLWEGHRGLAADIEHYGRWMEAEARRRIGANYPNVRERNGDVVTPIAWFWARTVPSPDPSWAAPVPLVGSWVLSDKPRRPIVWVEPVVNRTTREITYEIRVGGSPPPGTVERGHGACIATGSPIPGDYIKAQANAGHMGQVLVGIVAEGASGRVYISPSESDVVSLPAIKRPVVSGATPRYLTGGTCTVYGFEDWESLFTDRQLLALSTFSDLLDEVARRVVDDGRRAGLGVDERRLRDGGTGAIARADAIVTYLAMNVDRCSARWTHLAIWHTKGEKLEHVFRRQALPMTWLFAEGNPFSGSTGNWSGQLEWIIKCLIELPVSAQPAAVAQRDVRARIREVGPALLSTDPPYYDNISYADLSDFYFVWLRRNLATIWPDECATLLTPKSEELIANRHRAGSANAAKQHFEHGMREVFSAGREMALDGFPATIFYAFKASETTNEGIASTGWETFLEGILQGGWSITATWPIRTEMTTGVKLGKSMLASSVVLACRPREIAAPMATRGEFVAALRRELGPAVRLLQLENIAPVDLAQSAMGPGIATFSRYAKVVEADGSPMRVRTALALINEALAEVLSGEESEFDADTRFALTWFEQFGHNPGPFGDADLLARAKDTTVAGVERAGLVASRDGKVRLVERKELAGGWDPVTDARLTVWETTQHLIRALDSSETEAAALLARIGGGVGERARQLAYLLYGLCDRKKWAEEAAAYNMLVTAWPEISRLAAAGPAPETTGSLF